MEGDNAAIFLSDFNSWLNSVAEKPELIPGSEQLIPLSEFTNGGTREMMTAAIQSATTKPKKKSWLSKLLPWKALSRDEASETVRKQVEEAVGD